MDGSTRAVTQTNGVTFSVRDGATGGATSGATGGTGGTGTRGMSDVRGALDDSGGVSDGGSGGGSDSGSGEHSSDDRIEGSSRDDGGRGAGRRTYEKQDFHLVVGVKIAAYMRADRTAMRETWCVSLSVSLL